MTIAGPRKPVRLQSCKRFVFRFSVFASTCIVFLFLGAMYCFSSCNLSCEEYRCSSSSGLARQDVPIIAAGDGGGGWSLGRLFGRAANKPALSAFMVVLIMSSASNMERRVTIRQTWLKDVQSDVLHLFVIGSSVLDDDEKRTLESEISRFQDILFLTDVGDSYDNLTQKLLVALSWVDANVADYEFLLKADDDTFARLDDIAFELLSLRNKDRLYWGFFSGHSHVQRKGENHEVTTFSYRSAPSLTVTTRLSTFREPSRQVEFTRHSRASHPATRTDSHRRPVFRTRPTQHQGRPWSSDNATRQPGAWSPHRFTSRDRGAAFPLQVIPQPERSQPSQAWGRPQPERQYQQYPHGRPAYDGPPREHGRHLGAETHRPHYRSSPAKRARRSDSTEHLQAINPGVEPARRPTTTTTTLRSPAPDQCGERSHPGSTQRPPSTLLIGNGGPSQPTPAPAVSTDNQRLMSLSDLRSCAPDILRKWLEDMTVAIGLQQQSVTLSIPPPDPPVQVQPAACTTAVPVHTVADPSTEGECLVLTDLDTSLVDVDVSSGSSQHSHGVRAHTGVTSKTIAVVHHDDWGFRVSPTLEELASPDVTPATRTAARVETTHRPAEPVAQEGPASQQPSTAAPIPVLALPRLPSKKSKHHKKSTKSDKKTSRSKTL